MPSVSQGGRWRSGGAPCRTRWSMAAGTPPRDVQLEDVHVLVGGEGEQPVGVVVQLGERVGRRRDEVDGVVGEDGGHAVGLVGKLSARPPPSCRSAGTERPARGADGRRSEGAGGPLRERSSPRSGGCGNRASRACSSAGWVVLRPMPAREGPRGGARGGGSSVHGKGESVPMLDDSIRLRQHHGARPRSRARPRPRPCGRRPRRGHGPERPAARPFARRHRGDHGRRGGGRRPLRVPRAGLGRRAHAHRRRGAGAGRPRGSLRRPPRGWEAHLRVPTRRGPGRPGQRRRAGGAHRLDRLGGHRPAAQSRGDHRALDDGRGGGTRARGQPRSSSAGSTPTTA